MTMAVDCLHVFIFPYILACVGMTILEYGYRRLTLCMHTDRMKGSFVGKLPVGDLTGITTTPTAPDTHMIPTIATLEIRLRYPIRVEPTMATQWRNGGSRIQRLQLHELS